MDGLEEWEDVESGPALQDSPGQDGLSEQEADEELQIALHADPDVGPSQKKGKRSTVSSEDKAHALAVHRGNALCLISRAMVLDCLADAQETQAAMLSLLEPTMMQYVNSQYEAQRLINCLHPVVAWFKSQWQVIPVPPLPDDPDTAPNLEQQVLVAREADAGELEILVVLFVAMMRACGLLARVARLLDGAPLTPWKKPPGVKQLQKRVVKSAPAPTAARAKKLLDSSAGEALNETAAKKQPVGKRKRGAGSKAGPKGSTAGDEPEAEEGAADGVGPRKRSKADEEFETQLRMALLATEAAAQASKVAGASSTAAWAEEARTQGPAGNSKDGGKPPKRVLSRLAAAAAASSAGGSGGGGVKRSQSGPGPQIVSHTPEYPACWAEVWCGSAEYGRWVCVDLLAGLVDKPDHVATAIATAGGSAAASGYVVAVEHGQVVDVTSRYLTNSLWVKRARDNVWWAETLDKVKRLPVRAPASHLPAQHSNPATGQPATGSGAAGSSAGQPGPSSRPAGKGPSKVQLDAAQLRQQREAAELDHKAKTGLADLPTSIDGFQNHPLYVLKRHITKYQALQPGTVALGLHKGEPYYPRDALSELHTADRWRREGWQVMEAEIGKPVKVTKKRKQPALGGGGGGGRLFRTSVAAAYAATLEQPAARSSGGGTSSAAAGNNNAGDDRDGGGASGGAGLLGRDEPEEPDEPLGEEAGDAQQTLLYGKWQTEPFLPRAENGKVPKNDRGNVEVPPFSSAMPIGCVHLPYHSLPAICKSLNVDFAPALVGFELRAGRSVPKFEGVVICEEFEQQVTAAYIERESAREKAARAKHEHEMRTAWLQLLQSLLMRAQLASHYGDGAGAGRADGGVGAAGKSKGGKGRKQPAGKKGQQVLAATDADVSKVDAVRQRLLSEEEARAAEAQGGGVHDMDGVEAEEI